MAALRCTVLQNMNTVLSVNYGVDLFQGLQELGKKESRSVACQALFLLEVLAAVARQQPRFRSLLEAMPQQQPRQDHNRLEVPDELYDYLFDWAGHLGQKMTPFLRLLLYNGLLWHNRLRPAHLLTKEDYINYIIESVHEHAIH